LKAAKYFDFFLTRIAFLPLHFPCYMGINIPTKEELIANHLKAEQLAQTLGTKNK